MNWETYIAFGDSITIGARTYLGYPELVGKMLEEKTQKSWNVINHATSGYTAIDLVRSIDANIQHLKSSVPGICTLLIGTNDVKVNTDAGDFEIAINLLLQKIKLIAPSANIKTFDIPLFTKGIMYPYTIEMNERIPVYNALIEKAALRYDAKHYPLAVNDDELFDGVHLNKKGCNSVAGYISRLILADKGF